MSVEISRRRLFGYIGAAAAGGALSLGGVQRAIEAQDLRTNLTKKSFLFPNLQYLPLNSL